MGKGRPTTEVAVSRKQLFVEHYLRLNNATQAVVAAGYNCKEPNKQAYKLMQDPKIKAEIERRRAEVIEAAEEETEISLSEILRELKEVALSDIRQCFDESGALLPPHKWPDGVAKAISSVKVVEMAGGMKMGGEDDESPVEHIPMYTKELKLWDKNSALEKAMKHLGAFEKDNKQQQNYVPPIFNFIGVVSKKAE